MSFKPAVYRVRPNELAALHTACLPPGLELRAVVGFPGYLVRNDGRVYSYKRSSALRQVKPRAHHRTGHLRVRLYNERLPVRSNGKRWVDVYVHTLVCRAWHGPPPFDGALACHADDDPTNNRPGNLRWGTRKANAADAKRNAPERQHRAGMQLDAGPGVAVSAWGF